MPAREIAPAPLPRRQPGHCCANGGPAIARSWSATVARKLSFPESAVRVREIDEHAAVTHPGCALCPDRDKIGVPKQAPDSRPKARKKPPCRRAPGSAALRLRLSPNLSGAG